MGINYLLSPRPSPLSQSTVISNQTTSASKTNHPPVAQFDYRPKYLNPTDQQRVQFTNLSTDLDNDPLKYAWFVDDQLVSENKDYSAKLPVGEHLIRLNVSDSQAGDVTEQTVTVEPDEIYPTKQLHAKYKGVNYLVGDPFAHDPLSHKPPTTEEVDEQLDTIHDELACNAIVLIAGDGTEDNLIEGCKTAAQKHFESICAQIRYTNNTLDEIAKKLTDFAPRIRKLREASESIVFEFGCEFTWSSKGIIPGNTYPERIQYASTHRDWWNMMEEALPGYFKRIIPIIKSNYGYPAAYSAQDNEVHLVPWSDPVFGSIDFEAYLADKWHEDETFMIQRLLDLQKFKKPVNLSEFGCRSANGAAYDAGGDWDPNKPLDENEQANYIERYCNMVNKANANKPLATSVHYWQYYENWDKGFGLLSSDGTKRKKGFYIYKSYQRVT